MKNTETAIDPKSAAKSIADHYTAIGWKARTWDKSAFSRVYDGAVKICNEIGIPVID